MNEFIFGLRMLGEALIIFSLGLLSLSFAFGITMWTWEIFVAPKRRKQENEK